MALKAQIALPNLVQYSQLPAVERITYRNDYITNRMYSMDLEYSEYEASLTRERQKVGFLSDIAVLGVTTATPLVQAEATKNILAAVAAGLTGSRAAYNDEILLNRTVQIIQIQMRSSRALVSAQILQRLRLDDIAYPLATALSDLEEYYRAGTVAGALVHVSEAVGRNAQARRDLRDISIARSPTERLIFRARAAPADVEPRRASTPRSEPSRKSTGAPSPVADDPAARRLGAYLFPNGIPDRDRTTVLDQLLAKRGVTTPLAIVLSKPEFAGERAQLVRDVGLSP